MEDKVRISVQNTLKFLTDDQREYQANFAKKSREGQECGNTSDCASHDINMICRCVLIFLMQNISFVFRTHSNGTGSCVCRKDMRWNGLALECQLFLDVDCSSFTYSATVHPQLVTAATQLWHKQQGWTDEEDKKRKILALPRFFFKF